ncbi:MAG: transcriptional regulator [Epulopiscium sp. Nuni2H_MBin003]|nr:MAG: transcriptional regulator [Epulopiscium sp. Nuni2H_MBin003]
MQKQDLFGKCPYATVQKLLSGKWSIYILYLLSEQTLRFNEILRKMPEKMTHTTLSRQLKLLEKEGLIIRREYNQVPPKVEYELSEIGKNFIPVLNALKIWGEEYIVFHNLK